MPNSAKKERKITTNEALEQLLGKKAAKRLRQVAVQLATDPKKAKKSKKRRKSDNVEA